PPALFITSFCLGPVTRNPKLTLSTFYRAHRAYGFLLVSGDGHEVSFLNRAQRGIGVIGIGLVPVEAGEILLRPLIFEDLAVTGINFVAHLAHVFDEEAVQ